MAKKTPACGNCQAAPTNADRQAVGVDPELKRASLARLKRIEGQIRGIHKMLEDERYCADVLNQISAVHEALRGVGREVLRNHLRNCINHAVQAGGAEAEAAYDEVIDLMYKNAR